VRGRRGLLVALAGCVGAGALVLLASGRTWGRVVLTAQGGRQVVATATGHDAVGSLTALGFALLVLAGAVLAARSWLRVVVGVVTVAVGAAVVVLALTSRDDVAAALRREAFGVPGTAVHVSLSGWAVVVALAGLVAVVSGLLVGVNGRRWPALGARYEAPDRQARPAETMATAWDALDRGEDPTTH
jgi:uncharacterized membrane protein (TIGR02234 family)